MKTIFTLPEQIVVRIYVRNSSDALLDDSLVKVHVYIIKILFGIVIMIKFFKNQQKVDLHPRSRNFMVIIFRRIFMV